MSEIIVIMTAFVINNLIWMVFLSILLNSRRGATDRPIKLPISLPKVPGFSKQEPAQHEVDDLATNPPTIEEALKSLRGNNG